MEETENVRKAVGALLRDLRMKKGLSQYDLADILKCSRPNVTGQEISGVDSFGVVIRWCQALEIPLEDFFAALSLYLKTGKLPVGSPTVNLLVFKDETKGKIEQLFAREEIKCEVFVRIIPPQK